MKKIFLFSIAALLLVAMAGCKKISGKGDVVSEKRSVKGYTGINLSLPATVHFSYDTLNYLEIKAQDNLMGYIETYVEGSTLQVRLRDHYVLGKHDDIIINITSPEVRRLDISGSGTISIGGKLEISGIELNIGGSGNIEADSLVTDVLKAFISGSGSISGGGGKAQNANLSISGSGSIDLRSVMTDAVNASISGSGNIYCWAVNTLDASISGSGSIYYNGHPSVSTHISGSGNIYPL